MRAIALLFAIIFAALSLEAKAPSPKAKRYAKTFPLRGSKAVSMRQNFIANKQHLSRISDDAQLRKFVEQGLLVPLPDNKYVRVDDRLPQRYRYVRPWVYNWLMDKGKKRYREQGKGIKVNSGTRPVSRQIQIAKRNGNAAPVTGPYRSSHPTGATIDIAKDGDIAWFRKELWRDKDAGRIEVAEEFVQPVFHVMVFRPPVKRAPAKRQAARAGRDIAAKRN